MSVYFYTGKPRGGKSHLGVKTILAEFLKPLSERRLVVTNIRIFEDVLIELMHKKGVDIGLIAEQLRVLSDEETGEFWCYIPQHDLLDRKKIKLNKRGGELDVPDLDKLSELAPNGVLYVIDECHIFYPAREWQKTGSDCTYYLSQHGKLKHDVVLITQHPDQCDKALRRLTQEYAAVRNLSREPLFGFRLGNTFRIIRMLNSPTSPNPAIFSTEFMALDKDICRLYDTMQGVGIIGGMVATNQRKGISIWWLAVPVALVILFAFNFEWMFNKWMRWMGKTITRGVTHGMTNTLSKSSSSYLVAVKTNVPATAPRPTLEMPKPALRSYDVVTNTLQPSVAIRKWYLTTFRNRPVWSAVLTDNRVFTMDNATLGKVTLFGVYINGEFYAFRRWQEDTPQSIDITTPLGYDVPVASGADVIGAETVPVQTGNTNEKVKYHDVRRN